MSEHLSYFFCHNFYENILSPDYIEYNLLYLIALMLQEDINNIPTKYVNEPNKCNSIFCFFCELRYRLIDDIINPNNWNFINISKCNIFCLIMFHFWDMPLLVFSYARSNFNASPLIIFSVHKIIFRLDLLCDFES